MPFTFNFYDTTKKTASSRTAIRAERVKMTVGRFAVPMPAVAAVVILGVFAVGLIANAVLASEPEPEPPFFPRPGPDSKLTLVEDAAVQPVVISDERSATGSPSEKGTVYTWEDGDSTQRVVLQDGLVIQDNNAVNPDDEVIVRGLSESIVQKSTGEVVDSRPVFRSESGGELMTLPGGVLVALDPEWDEQEVEEFFAQNGISLDSVTALAFIQNGFLVDTEPGFPSLELANELAAHDGVEIASPNWWREAQAK